MLSGLTLQVYMPTLGGSTVTSVNHGNCGSADSGIGRTLVSVGLWYGSTDGKVGLGHAERQGVPGLVATEVSSEDRPGCNRLDL